MLNWERVKLGNVADVKLSNVDKKTNADERQVRLCNYTDVYRNAFINSEKARTFMVASCNKNEFENFRLKKGQVAITKDSETRDDIGVSTFIAEDFDDVVLGYHTSLITPDERYLNGKFLHYWLNTRQAKTYFENNAGGSGQRCTLPLDIIKTFPLYLPDIVTQGKIASFFYSVDSKIELNNKINTELEAMTKLIYDYWFVQFDFPNAKGKPYKTSGGKMVWNEELKREIPRGWQQGTLSDIANITMGQSPPGESYNDDSEGMIFFQGCTDFGVRFPEVRQFTTAPSRFAKAGEILLSVRAPVGALNIAKDDCCIGRGLAALNSKDNCIAYLFGVVKNLKQVFDRRNVNGTTFGSINKDDLCSLSVVKPDKESLRKFNNITTSIFEKQNVIALENQKLLALRDWLLPMLMNGQVQIKETGVSNGVKQAVKEAPFKPTSTYFYQTQVIAAIVNASRKNSVKHGEMTLAKYSYLLDKVYNVPTLFTYDRWHLGPYPKEMKKVVLNKKFFKIQNNEVTVVPQKKEYKYQFQQQVEDAVTELASIFNQYKGQERSYQTELLATVCKVVEDIQSTDLMAVSESMKKWPIKLETSKFKNKAEKFGEEEIKTVLKFIVKKEWNRALIKA
jgi:type I restriction enzyme, S subunit